MAISANRSPSPTPNSNSRPNTNPRNLEAGSPIRRSFNGNPLQRPSIYTNPSRSFIPATPANSPSDSSSRNLLGKEGKENESDHQTVKPAKTRSPAVPKGSNHFMAPTISAASKFNPSPRKKVLADRNEPLTFPLSLSDCDKKPSKTCNSNDEKHNNKPMFSTTTNSLVSSVSPNIAPLDADPSSIPPYDPKTNYLSPRPQFLHYRPNPRLELYFQKEKGSGTKNLEEVFLSESFSDSEFSEGSETEVSEKESEDDSSAADVLIQDFQKESEDASSVEVVCERAHAKDSKLEQITSKEVGPKNSRKEFEDDSSVEVVTKGDEAEVTEEPEPKSLQKECEDASPVEVITDISKSKSLDASLDDAIVKESVPEVYVSEPIREKSVVMSRVFMRAKFIPFLLVILVTCLSMPFTDSPFFDRPVHENLSSCKFYEENFSSVARNLKQWSDYSTSYVSELISSLSGVDKSSPVQFSNLTHSLVDPFIDAKWHEEINEEDDQNSVDESRPVQFSNLTYSLVDPFIDAKWHEEINEEDDQNSVDESEIVQPITDSDLQNGINLEKKPHLEEDFNSELSETVGMEGDYDIVTNEISSEEASSDVVTNVIESSTEVTTTTQGDHISEFETKPNEVHTDSENTMEMDAFTSDLTPKKYYMAISLIALALIAAAAPLLIFLKRRSKNTNTRNGITEVNDRVGESCSSEMSYSYGKSCARGTTNEVESQERKQKRALKRESLASSMDLSMNDSPSYGSFTTYERLPRSKHGYVVDDEVATPVRRSSRIKKIQVTSP